MHYRSIKGFTGFGQLGILCVFLGLGFILAGGVQLLIGLQMIAPGTAFKDMGKQMLEAMGKPENITLTRLSQVTGTFLLLFVPAVLYSWVTNGRNKFWMGFNSEINATQIFLGFAIIFAANVLAAPLADITKSIVVHIPSLDTVAKSLEKTYEDQVVILSNLKSWPEFLMAVIIMAFFPALFEEVFFRGAMQNLLVRWWKKPLLAILITSIIFSFIHSSVYLFVSRVALGFALGLMFHISKNLWVNIIAHFLNNLIAVSQLFYMSINKQKIDPGKLDPKFDWWISLLAVAALYFLIKKLNEVSVKNREKIEAKEKLLQAKENLYDPFANNENN